jgi:hypothetical protein
MDLPNAALVASLLTTVVSHTGFGAEDSALAIPRDVSQRYHAASETLQREHTAPPNDPELRDKCRDWLASVLQPRWLPPDGTRWPYLRLSRDEVESLVQNYFFLGYRCDDTDIWIRGYPFGMYAVFQPPEPLHSSALGDALAEAQRRAESGEHAHHVGRAASLSGDLKALLDQLWGTYLQVPLRSFDEGPKAHRPIVNASPFSVQVHTVELEVPGEGRGCDGRLWTDGRSVGISVLRPHYELEAATMAVWGGTPSGPGITPLNATEVLLEDLHRYVRDVDGEEVRTNAPGALGSAYVQVVYRKPWPFTSTYADRGELVKQLRGYWVTAHNGHVPEATWRLLEFHALTVQTLHCARATLFQPELATDLRHGQTRRQAWVGLRALHNDYASILERYRQLRSPRQFTKTGQAVDEALAAGAASWGLIKAHWRGPLEADRHGDEQRDLAEWAAFAQQLQAQGLGPAQVRARLQRQQEAIDGLLAAHGAAEAVPIQQ